MPKLKLVSSEQVPAEESKPFNLTASVYQSLRSDLLSGKFSPGIRLGIRALQERYGTGATPVREVLNRLSAEGFVQQIDQKGFRVPEFSQEQLTDLIRARCLLNEIMLKEAIAQANDATDEAIVLAHFRLSRTPQMMPGTTTVLNPEIEEAHKRFHRTLVEPCGSQWLLEFNERLFDQTTRYRALAAPKQSHPDEDHRLMMEAVLDRNVERAVALSNAHIERTAVLAAEALSQSGDDGREIAAGTDT